MTSPSVCTPDYTALTAEDILFWIRHHPDFLVRFAGELADLQPEADNVTPLHAFKAVRAERGREKLEQKHQKLINTVHANTEAAAGLFAVIPEMVKCQTLPQLRTFLQTTLPEMLDLAAVRLFLVGEHATATRLPAQDILDLCPTSVRLRTLQDAEDRALYGAKGKMFQSDVLLCLQTADGQVLGMLALASENSQRFYPGQGHELADFFAQVASVVLEICLKDA